MPPRLPRRWLPATAGVVAAAGVLGAFFLADRGPDEALSSRAIAAQARPELERRFDTGLLLSLAAWQTADTVEARDVALTATQRADRMRGLLRSRSGGEVSAVAQDGDVLAVADGAAVTVFERRRRLPTRLVSPDQTEPVAIAVSAGGERVAAAFARAVVLHHRGNTITLAGQVTALAFSDDGALLAGAGPGELRVWDVTTGRVVHADDTERAGTSASIRFTRDGLLGEIRDRRLTFWDLSDWRPVRSKPVPLSGDVALSRDLEVASDGRALWRPGTGTVLSLAEGTRAAFSPNAQRVAVLEQDGTIGIFDASTGLELGRPLTGGGDAIALAWPDERTIVSGGRSGLTTLWNALPPGPARLGAHVAYGSTGAFAWFNGAYLSLEAAPGDRPLERSVNGLALAFAPGGETLAIAEPARIRLFGLALQARGQHFPDAPLTALAAGPDNRFVYGDRNGQVHVWTARVGEVASSQPTPSTLGAPESVGAVAFSPDGDNVAASLGNTVRLYRVAGNQLPDGPLLNGHDARVTAIAFSPGGRLVATASADATTRLWSARTGAAIATLVASGPNAALAFTPDGRTLAAAQAGSITFYDVATRRRLGEPLPAGGPTALAFSPDGRTLAAGGVPLERYDGANWARSAEQIGRRLCAIVGRELTRGERPEGLKDPVCR